MKNPLGFMFAFCALWGVGLASTPETQLLISPDYTIASPFEKTSKLTSD